MRTEQEGTSNTNEKKSLLLLIATVALPLAGSALTTYLVYNKFFVWENLDFTEGLICTLVFAVTMGLAITPTTFVAVLMGIYLNWLGLLVVVPANILASVLGYSIGKKVDARKLLDRLYASQNKIKEVVDNFKSSETGFMFFVRLSPILPFAFMNIVCAYMGINFRKFVWAGALGMLPRIIISVYAGSQIRNIVEYWQSGKEMDLAQISAMIFVIVSVVGIILLARKRK